MPYLFLVFFFFAFFLSAPSYGQKTCAADTTRANELFVLGEKLQKASKLDSAALYYEQAAEIWEKACPEIEGEKRKRFRDERLKNKNRRGFIFYLQGKADFAAIYYLQDALQEALSLGGDHPEAANSYSNLGIVYYSKGRYAEALEYFQKALAIRLVAFGENHIEVASSYNSMGNTYSSQGRYAEALEYFQKALAIRLVAFGENHPEVAGIYNNMANIYYSQTRYAEALQYHQKALAVRLAAFGENHPTVASSYYNMANVYLKQGQRSEALQSYQKALAIRLVVFGNNHPAVASSYNNIANVYESDRYAEALEYYRKALDINLAVFGENHPNLAFSYNNIGVVYASQGRYAEALQYYQKALAIYLVAFGKNHPDVANTYNNIGDMYSYQGRYSEALAYFQEALASNTFSWKPEKEFDLPPLNSPTLNREFLFATLQKQSQTLFNAYLSPEHSSTYRPYLSYALEATRYGANVLAKWRQAMRRESDQIELGNQATELFSTGIACAFLMDSLGFKEQSPLKEAFFFSESNKAAALNLAMQESEALVAAGIPESLNALQQDYKRELTLCNQQLETVLKPETKEDTLKKQYYENRRFTYAAKLDSLIHILEKEYPKYYELKYATFVASVDTLQKTLFARSPNTAIVEYLVSDTAIFVFAINAKVFAAKKILFSQKELKRLMNELGRSYYVLTESERQDPMKKQNYIAAAAQLYQKLIAPVEGVLKNKELVIVPDGLLWELPFEILIKAPSQAEAQKLQKLAFEKLPLLNQFHSVRYSPSATAFFRSFGLPPCSCKGIFAVAPVFDAPEENILISRAASNRDVVYPELVAPLPGSESEVEELKKLFQKQNLPVKLLIRSWAKEEIFTGSPLASFRYIHLATHGVFNRNKPSWSYLLFSRPADTAASLERDGLLTAAECYNLKLDCELISLSACETARGELKPGEGLVGLTRGLLYSGARAVLVSQWKVPDVATSKLMQVFYQNLLNGMSKPSALQAAKETMRKRGFAHPYYWAAFVLIGG
jgi:CHAT domain-containing protein/Tfp pilus assembly protein PilF